MPDAASRFPLDILAVGGWMEVLQLSLERELGVPAAQDGGEGEREAGCGRA